MGWYSLAVVALGSLLAAGLIAGWIGVALFGGFFLIIMLGRTLDDDPPWDTWRSRNGESNW